MHLERCKDLLDLFVDFSVAHSKTWSVPGFEPLRVSRDIVMTALSRLGTAKGVEDAQKLLVKMIKLSSTKKNANPDDGEGRLALIATPTADSYGIVLHGWASLKTAQGGKQADDVFAAIPQPLLSEEKLWVLRASAWSELGTTGAALMTQQVAQEALAAKSTSVLKVTTAAMDAWISSVPPLTDSSASSEVVYKVEQMVQQLVANGIALDMVAFNKLAETYSSFDLPDKLFALLASESYVQCMSRSVEEGQDTSFVLPPFIHCIRRMRNPQERKTRLEEVALFATERRIRVNFVSYNLLKMIPEGTVYFNLPNPRKKLATSRKGVTLSTIASI